MLILLASATSVYALWDILPVAPLGRQIVSASGATSQKGDDARAIEPGKPIEREIVGGESHFYLLTLAAGQYAQVIIDQRRINIAVSAFAPDGQKIAEADLFAIGDSEAISLVAETSTSYRLEVLAPDKAAPRGSYEIKIYELRAATEQDKNLIAAQKLIAEGVRLRAQPATDSWLKAVEKYKQAVPLCQSAKDPAWEASALYLVSGVYISLGDKQKAFDFANQALPLAQAAARRAGEEERRVGIKTEASALDMIGRAHMEFGDMKKAIELFNQALPLRLAAADRAGEINTLNFIGMTYGYMGEARKALEFFDRAHLILRELGDSRNEASVLNNMCVIHNNLGEYKKGLGFCNQALSIRQALNDRQGEAIALGNIGASYSSMGEYQEALDSYNQSLAIYRDSNNRRSEAISMHNIGWVYGVLGEYQKAIDLYNQALEIFRATSDRYREAKTLSNVGVNYARLGDYRKALDIHQQTLPIQIAVHDQEGEASTLNHIANCSERLGEKRKALDYYEKALSLETSPRQRVATLSAIGAFHRDLGDNQKAIEYLNDGLRLSRTIGDRTGEAGILAHIALLERYRGDLVEARRRIEEALAAVESLRISVKSHQLRASFLASVRKYYEFDIDVLMRLHKERPSEGFDAAALHASEMARARSLLELLTEANAEIRRDVDPALVERERSLRQMISDRAERQMRLLSDKRPKDQAAAAAEELAKELDELTTEYEQTEARIRQTSPRYAGLTQPVPLNLKEIQGKALDADTLLLEYALGEEKSYLWAVTPDSVMSFELPGRAEIETAARRVYEMLTARNQFAPGETPEQRNRRVSAADAEYPKASAALSRMLLGPVASQLGTKRLLIVSEGALQYVPFAALPLPGTEEQKDILAIVRHEIVSLQSASVLVALRREVAGRGSAAKTVAVLADPVFNRNDPRISRPGESRAEEVDGAPTINNVRRSATESGLEDLVRLRFSRQEAEEIIRLAPEGKALKALDFAASRATAAGAEIGQYAIVHFATHGVINNQHPELSGIVLSLVDEQGRPQNGFLGLHEIYNLRLGADLVTLSACQTALGKDVKGEGLVGLTRGFMYAGAPRVAASLWRIDDRASAEFMKRFYAAILRDRQRPAAALRAAQISLLKEKRWEAPHYWAAFILQGEWQ